MFPKQVIPSSSTYTIVFPWNKTLNQFDKSSYQSSMTDEKVLEHDINSALISFDSLAAQSSHDSVKVLTIQFIVFLALCPIFYPPINCVYLLLAYSICLGYFIKTREISCKKTIKQQILTKLNQNGSLFEKHSLRWNIPLTFPLYVELCLDYKDLEIMVPNSQAPGPLDQKVLVKIEE